MNLVAAILALSLLLSPASIAYAAHGDEVAGACPTSRKHIEPSLKTTLEDGKYYEMTRRSARMPIDDVLQYLGGRAKARRIAHATRDDAVKKLEDGAKDAEKRFHEDTILRADALLAILDCLENDQPV
jgi:hypothetical protein